MHYYYKEMIRFNYNYIWVITTVSNLFIVMQKVKILILTLTLFVTVENLKIILYQI
jgi:hypothetical protein